jgi:hypothetical protein
MGGGGFIGIGVVTESLQKCWGEGLEGGGCLRDASRGTLFGEGVLPEESLEMVIPRGSKMEIPCKRDRFIRLGGGGGGSALLYCSDD